MEVGRETLGQLGHHGPVSRHPPKHPEREGKRERVAEIQRRAPAAGGGKRRIHRRRLGNDVGACGVQRRRRPVVRVQGLGAGAGRVGRRLGGVVHHAAAAAVGSRLLRRGGLPAGGGEVLGLKGPRLVRTFI